MPRRIPFAGVRLVSALASDGRRAWLLGLGCWTGFLAESEEFVAFAQELVEQAARSDADGLADGERPLLQQAFGSTTVALAMQQAERRFGGAVRLVDFARLASPAGRVGAYVHHDHRVGALVSLSASGPAPAVERMLNSLCQHVVAFRPARLEVGNPAGAPTGEALLDQPWIHDPAMTVREALARELGPEARVEGFRVLWLRR